jgi:SLOG cluster3 family
MTIRFEGAMDTFPLDGATVFLSASIPNPERWDGPFDPLAITDAIVALGRVFLTAGARIVTAAHPTIAPLLLYVAAELPPDHPRRIITYQSRLFQDVLPAATRRFADEGIGEFIWTDAAIEERPVPGEWHESLAVMRNQMLAETSPTAATFIGGMEGITDEFEMFTRLYPEAPTYAAGRPGGEAARLVEASPPSLRDELAGNPRYPAVWRQVATDLQRRLNL